MENDCCCKLYVREWFKVRRQSKEDRENFDAWMSSICDDEIYEFR